MVEATVGVALRGHPSVGIGTWGGHGGRPLQSIRRAGPFF